MIKPDLSQPPGNRLALLYQLTQTFNSSLNLEEVLNLVMDEVIKAMHAERGFVMLSESNSKLIFQVARGIDQQLIDQPQFQISRSVVERVAREGVSILTDDAQTDVRFSGRQSVMILGLRSILCAPLKLKDNILGVIYIDNRLQAGIFNQSDLELLTAIAANAAVAIENARLFRDAQDKLQTLRLLQEISADLTSTLDLECVLTACLQRVQETFNAEAASIFTVEGDDLLFQIALGEKSTEIKPFRVQLGKGFAGWVVQNKQGVIVNDVHNDPRFYNAVDAVSGLVTQCVMAAPLIVNDQVIGVIEIFNKKTGNFSNIDLNLLSTIASTASNAIDNAKLYEVAVEKGRMERELQMARKMQVRLLPNITPLVPGWDFAAKWLPALEVAGDYYDYILYENGNIGLVIADVTDKGMPAALFMALTRSIVRASLDRATSPSQDLTRANYLICAESADGYFVTLVYAQLNPHSGEITYVNAGHNPPLLYRSGIGYLEYFTTTGMALGIQSDFIFNQRSIQLNSGDFILFYTDGIIDAIDGAGNEFGRERLEKIIKEHQEATAAEIVAILEKEVSDFTSASVPFDDITLMVVKRL